MTGLTGGEPERSGRVLWVLRHAMADADPPKGGTDHDRRLAPRGRRDATALGLRLGPSGDHLGLADGLLPGVVLCSTAARAAQTAERAVAAMVGHVAVAHRRSLYGAGPAGILEAVRSVDDEVASVMVVGHNPALEELVGDLLADGAHGAGDALERLHRRGLPTCALAVLGLPAAHWRDVEEGTAALTGLFRPPY